MAINYFIGWSTAELEAELRAAQEDLAAGKSTIAAGAGDANTQSRIEKTPEERVRMILRELNQREPEKYPIANVTAITTTKAVFS
jgi:hypothetical protein